MNSTGLLLIAPIVIPLLTAIAGFFGLALQPGRNKNSGQNKNSRQVQRVISSVGAVLLLFFALV